MNDNEISNKVDEFPKSINFKSDEFKIEFKKGEKNIEKKLKRN